MKSLPRINVNGKIRASQVKVVSEDGEELGVFSIGNALKLVASRRQDLVEIEPDSTPPVCMAIDFGLYRYRQAKAEKDRRRGLGGD
jgi:translation initiation factor IF-3